MSVRLAVARDQGLDEEDIAVAERGEDADPRHRAARMLADDLMTQPGRMREEDALTLRAAFTPSQIRELTLDVMKWNYQKVSVALGVDDEVRPGERTDLVFDADGNWMRPA